MDKKRIRAIPFFCVAYRGDPPSVSDNALRFLGNRVLPLRSKMPIGQFHYLAPRTIQEACLFLSEHHEEARVLAGGQSLIPLMNMGLVQPKYIVDLKRISGLSFIDLRHEEAGDVIAIGALVTHQEVHSSDLIRKLVPLLSETAGSIGHPQIRNRGTIGGSLSHCDPAADLVPTTLVLEASIVVVSKDGSRRRIPAEQFFKGTFATDLTEGELLEQVLVPVPKTGLRHSFQKLSLGHGGFPLVVVSLLADVGNENVLKHLSLALGGVAEVGYRAHKVEQLLTGKKVGEHEIHQASVLASEETSPGSDIDVSSDYKRKMVRVLVRRSLQSVLNRK